MYKKSLIMVSLFFVSFLINADSVSLAEEMCGCLKVAKSSDKKADKKKCLILRENHVKEIGKTSPEYQTYVKKLSECEKDMMVKPADTSLEFDEKVKQVCDCFQSKKSKPTCFMMQSDYAKTISDLEKKKEFNLSTGSCDK